MTSDRPVQSVPLPYVQMNASGVLVGSGPYLRSGSGATSPVPRSEERAQTEPTPPPTKSVQIKEQVQKEDTDTSEEEESSEQDETAVVEEQPDTLRQQSTSLPRQSTSYRFNKAKAESTKASFKRPQWYMLIFGNVLCLMAGIVDVGSIKCFDVTTTHVTGNTAKLGLWLEHESVNHWGLAKAEKAGLCVLFFCLGSFVCGLIIPKTQIHFGGKGLYGTALIAECTLLLCTKYFPEHEFAPYWTSTAAGLQNAMCTMHFGAIVRTTHVTGTITDIGSTTGRAVMLCARRFFHKEGSGKQLLDEAELQVDKTKLIVLVPLYISFFSGCLLGAMLYRMMGVDVFLVPAGVTGTLGLIYTCMREKLKMTFKSIEKNQLLIDMNEIQEVIDRTQATLRRLHHRQTSREDKHIDDVDELDDQLRHMADMMQDVQDTIGEMYEDESEARLRQHRIRMNTV